MHVSTTIDDAYVLAAGAPNMQHWLLLLRGLLEPQVGPTHAATHVKHGHSDIVPCLLMNRVGYE